MRRALWWLGVANFLALGAHAIFSYVEAGAAGYQARPYGQIAFHTALGDRIADAVVVLAPRRILLSVLRIDSETQGSAASLAHDDAFVLREFQRRLAWSVGGDLLQPVGLLKLYTVPLLVSTVAAVLALVVVVSSKQNADDATVRSLLKWAIAFAAVMAIALPVLSSDFWLSFAWGRTLWWGGNPFHHVPAQAVAGLPFDAPVNRMPYSPVLALISWCVTAVTRGSVLWSAVLLKALLVTAWATTLWLVGRIVEGRRAWEQCAALIAAGWIPLAAVQVAGEGHSVALSLVALVSWLFLMKGGSTRWATLALTLAVLVEFSLAPLFVVDVLRARSAGGYSRSWRGTVAHYLPNAAGALSVMALAVVAVPWPASLAWAARGTHSYLPKDALAALGAVDGLGYGLLTSAVNLTFLAIALWGLRQLWRRPGFDHLLLAVVGVLVVVLFVMRPTLSPWETLWLSVPAALLIPSTRLGLLSAGLAMAASFPLVLTVTHPDASGLLKLGIPAIAMYAAAVVWMFIARRYLRAVRPVA